MSTTSTAVTRTREILSIRIRLPRRECGRIEKEARTAKASRPSRCSSGMVNDRRLQCIDISRDRRLNIVSAVFIEWSTRLGTLQSIRPHSGFQSVWSHRRRSMRAETRSRRPHDEICEFYELLPGGSDGPSLTFPPASGNMRE
ncbi:hypothetical protein EVAR_5566_1 [Eumeta japonica]|uniref:Uncharacterized protein n=1 Tax=Eumeta variegata TaxID=151549 RepID=A0A4C1U2S8_EUMVA|nr:hypothetical protein EVAR_5566_1 [Eumeta japonica]